MRKWMTFLTALMVGASSYTFAHGDIGVEIGYRQDSVNLKHSFGEDFEFRQDFHDLDIFQIGLKAKGALGCNFYGRAEGTWGWILDGDYTRKFTATEGSGSYSGLALTEKNRNVADDRYVFDANVAIGYPFYFCDCTMSAAPVVGYAFDEQNLRVNGNNNEGYDYDYDYGDDFFGFNEGGCCPQKFINRWYGPFIGIDFEYRPCNECWNVFAELEFHWVHFKERSHGNVIGSDFQQFRASHHGHGVVFNIGAEYDFCNCWTASLAVKFSDFRAHRNHGCGGFDYDYYGNSLSGEGRGNYKWRSYAVNFLVGRGF